MSAHDVAVELRKRMPGLPTKKLHKLLYYCQGHHLAHFGEPLFAEPIMAYDMGPVVANLWWQEKTYGVALLTGDLDNGKLNTIAYVINRYGQLSGADLQRLTHSERPWQAADRGRERGGSVRIDVEDIRAFFVSEAADDDEDSPSTATVTAWLATVPHDRDSPARVDSREEILARLSSLA